MRTLQILWNVLIETILHPTTSSILVIQDGRVMKVRREKLHIRKGTK